MFLYVILLASHLPLMHYFFFIQILGTVTVVSFSIALALKKANFVSRNIGQFNDSAVLPLCRFCIVAGGPLRG